MDQYIKKTNSQADIRLVGKFSFSDLAKFKEVFNLAEDENIQYIMLDFTEVDFIDSAALGMLLRLHNLTKDKNKAIALNGAKDKVEKILRLSKFDTFFSIN